MTARDLIFAASTVVAAVGIVGLVAIVCRLLESMPPGESESHDERCALGPRHLVRPADPASASIDAYRLVARTGHVRLVLPPYDWSSALDSPNHRKENHE